MRRQNVERIRISFVLTSSLIFVTPISAEVRQAIAPRGCLRASINLGNPILAQRDAGGNLHGVSIDLAQAMAERLGLGCELLVSDSAAKSVELVRGDHADLVFFAIDPMRSDGILFTSPYVLIEGAYLVRDSSAIRNNDEVDRPGTRITVGAGSAYDLFLTRHIQHASLVRAATSPAVVATFLANGDHVAAGVKQQLESDAQRTSGLRLLPGAFMVIQQAMGLPASRGEPARAWMAGFLESMKSSGFVAAALNRHRIAGAAVAPVA